MLGLLLIASPAFSAVPNLINYQGRLTNSSGQPVPDGPYQIKFKIYASALGLDSLWGSGFQSVNVSGGGFSYDIGSSGSMPTNLFATDTVRYLGITVGSDPEMTPRVRLTSVAYAFKALNADSAGYATTVPDLSITNAKISNSANISPSKIAGGAAVENGSNQFTGEQRMFDSAFVCNANGIRIGTSAAPMPEHIFEVKRHFNSSNYKDGIVVNVENGGTGGLYGIDVNAENTITGGGGSVYGISVTGISDGSTRSGLYAVAQCQTASTSTGSTIGVYGNAFDGATAYGVYGYAGSATTNYAGYFSGNAHVTGTLTKGGGSFKIDHPLDPENKNLQHSFVESPDMMNIYNGNVILDSHGEATVTMPDWFEALNRDFRYQLTCIGGFAPVYVAQEISGNQFKIAGGNAGLKVSWMVTGIRHDAWANANRIPVDTDKRAEERGMYLHPEAFGKAIDKGVDYESIRPALEAHNAAVQSK